MAITIRELAEYRLDQAGILPEGDSLNGGDFARAGLCIVGGCATCGASLAAYNGYPSKTGYWLCRDCLCGQGWETVEQANADIFENAARDDEWDGEREGWLG